MPTIAIIGSGFTGTMIAVRLLKAPSAAPCRIVLIDRSGGFGQGVAYGTTCHHHLLNVPAGRMSAFEEDQDSFLRWARERDSSISGGSFVPRRLYGQYLGWLLDASAKEAPGHLSLERIAAEATDVRPAPHGTSLEIALSDGRSIPADKAVIAVGNFPPSNPCGLPDAVLRHPRYLRDPWTGARLRDITKEDSVVLIGTGLTMVDLALELMNAGHQGVIHAISRRGLLPRPHRSPAKPSHPPPPADLDQWPATTRGMLRRLREAIDEQARQGINWREVITSLRHDTPKLWQRLSEKERRRFLSAVRPFWEVHRHRAAPQAWEALTKLRESGQLSIIAARLCGGTCDANAISMNLTPRGSDQASTLRADWIINCTGPDTDLQRIADPLIANLRQRRMIRPDPLGLGLDSAETGAAINTDGDASPSLYLAGPLRKGQFWENTAVPELRIEAAVLAQHLARTLELDAKPGAMTRGN